MFGPENSEYFARKMDGTPYPPPSLVRPCLTVFSILIAVVCMAKEHNQGTYCLNFLITILYRIQINWLKKSGAEFLHISKKPFYFCFRNFLYVTDAAEAFISILHKGFAGQCLNASTLWHLIS